MFKFLRKMKKNRKGYTLTELIVVVAILGVLAAVGTPMIMNQVATARENADNANATAISNAYKIEIASSEVAHPTPTNRTQALAIIHLRLNPIPAPRQTDFEFYLDNGSGNVVCAATKPAASAASATVIDLTTP